MAKQTVKIKDGMINFSCRMHLCQHSCCGPFAGVAQHIASVEDRPFEEIVLTPEDYKQIYSAGYADLIEESVSPQTGRTYYKMALEADGTCKALKKGLCSIQNVKPTLCRAFPFYFDMFAGLCAIDCDGFSDDYWTELENCQYALEAARKMYEFWLDFYIPRKERENGDGEGDL